jgi:methionyl aminopeptidase
MIKIKGPQEIVEQKKACQVVAKVIEAVAKEARPGITTLALDALAESLIREAGAYPSFIGYRGYKHATCISVNEQVVHGIPGQRQIQSGDIVSIDVGAMLNGYHGDRAMTVAVGDVSKEVKRLIRVTEEALSLAIKEAWPGKHLGDISHVIQAHAEKNGFSVVKDLYGHGIGKDLHEDPLIPNFGKRGEGPELKPGMVLAIEPMVNAGGSGIKTLKDGWTVVTRDGRLSAHFEHTILITEGEPEVLTCLKKKIP